MTSIYYTRQFVGNTYSYNYSTVPISTVLQEYILPITRTLIAQTTYDLSTWPSQIINYPAGVTFILPSPETNRRYFFGNTLSNTYYLSSTSSINGSTSLYTANVPLLVMPTYDGNWTTSPIGIQDYIPTYNYPAYTVSQSVELTLPKITNIDKLFSIKIYDADGNCELNNITVSPAGGDYIMDETDMIISVNRTSINLAHDGINKWFVN